MDSFESIGNLRETVAEIDKILNWMEKSNEVSQIDVDVLLEKMRLLYTGLIQLPLGRIASQSIEKETEEKTFTVAVTEAIAEAGEVAEAALVKEKKIADDVEVADEEELADEEEVKEEEEEIRVNLIPEFLHEPVPEPQLQVYPTQRQPSFQSHPQPQQPPQSQEPENPQIPEFPQQHQHRHLLQPELFVTAKEPSPVQASLIPRKDSLNEALGKQKPIHDLASTITDLPVADIWSVITINERFLFIRELFSNDPEGFKNTVTLLNSLGSWETAKIYLADHFDWDQDNPVVIDFLNVVRRRFI